MSDKNCFQDWDTVVLKKHTPPKGNALYKSSFPKKNEDCDSNKLLKITNELKLSIQQARVNKKLSQKQLANLLGCQQTVINQYENGKAIPNNHFISKLERILNVKLPRIKKEKKTM